MTQHEEKKWKVNLRAAYIFFTKTGERNSMRGYFQIAKLAQMLHLTLALYLRSSSKC